MADFVFQRKEQKYLLDPTQRTALVQCMEARMEKDRYHESRVRNIYYDTPDYRLIRRSLEKPVYKEKLRLRCYGEIGENDRVFLEMKKKYKGIVYKRRVALTEQDARRYLESPEARLEAGQIGRELDYFKDFYRELRPAVYLQYDRLAWKSADKQLRITLDYNVCYRREQLTLASPCGGQLLEPELAILEIKTAGGMPLWLAAFLSEHEIRQCSCSKYGTVYMRLLKEKNLESRGNIYA